MVQVQHSEMKSRPRWWEDYLVRYFTGTLVGTACVFILVTEIFFSGDVTMLAKRMFFSPDKDSTWLGLIVLIAAGGAYCYLASVPITVFHSGRMIREGMNAWARRAWYWWWGFALAVLVIGFAVYSYYPTTKYYVQTFFLCLTIGPVFWLFLGQLDVIYRLKEKQGTTDAPFLVYYRRLVRSRDRAADSGIRESYTHLREHANSVFIVVIELSMLSTLLLVWSLIHEAVFFAAWCLVFLLLWTTPNVLLWGLANSLEKDLADNPSEYVE